LATALSSAAAAPFQRRKKVNMPQTAPASPWVTRFLSKTRRGARVLDLACGSGRHIHAALDSGLIVTGIDRDISKSQVFADNDRVTLIEADLESGGPLPFSPASFDAVIVTNYLWRPILSAIVAAVAPNGILIYETFAVGNERFGRPSNPDFLLRPGELIGAVHGQLTPIHYEHAQLSAPDRIVQRICATGKDHEWLSAPPLI
jgi:SAM-dependent methyltransferase